MINERVPLDDIAHWAPPGSCTSLHLLRLDAIHPVVSGNKWFKLQPNLEAAKAAGCSGVLSFGGGWSNHLVALAFAAAQAGLRSTGVVRGMYPQLTPSLRVCMEFGMELRFVHAGEYAALRAGVDPALAAAYPGYFIIPEGGANSFGLDGAARIAALIPDTTTDVCLAVGTGTTLGGLDRGLPAYQQLQGYCVAQECSAAEALLRAGPCPQRIHWHRVADPRFGRWKPELSAFMRDFYAKTGIKLDVVYTGKMMQAVYAQLCDGRFLERRVVCVHTGGLQGNPPGLFTGG